MGSRAARFSHMVPGDGWQRFEHVDVVDEKLPKPNRHRPVACEEDVEALRALCLPLGFGGFVVRKGVASLRPFDREHLLRHKAGGLWERGAVLHVAPSVAPEAEEGVLVTFGGRSRRCGREVLASRSGYFASLLRHTWCDAERHGFAEFPGGGRAFDVALAWLSASAERSVAAPWPLRGVEDVLLAIGASAYLDAPELLRAAVRSWAFAAERSQEELLEVAAAMAEGPLGRQELVVEELRQLLQDLPRHQLPLAPELLQAPAAGLAILEIRSVARESLAGHLRSVGLWVGSVLNGTPPSPREVPCAHDFAVRLFERHEAYFVASPPMLRRLLQHLDPAQPVVPPLCFRIAAAAIAEGAGDLGLRIFERSLASAPSPADAAADPACAVGLFGMHAGAPLLRLGVLGSTLVPPAASAVILSRVLSSWAAGEADVAEIILDGVICDRQELRAMLSVAAERIAEASDREDGLSCAEWGSSFDIAVPELRAALEKALGRVEAPALEAARLLFRVLFQPTGGLPGLDFPLRLLGEVRGHNSGCQRLAARCVVERLKESFDAGPALAWRLALESWPYVVWESVDEGALRDAILLLRGWLASAARDPRAHGPTDPAQTSMRLLLQLPLRRLENSEDLLGPPVPAHVMAALALRRAEEVAAEVAGLRAENAALRGEVSRLAADVRRNS